MKQRICVYLCIAVVSLFLTITTQAQLPIESIFQKAYQNGTRDLSGSPGAKYWQNTANYDLKIDFNPVSREIKGTVEIQYFNNSTDTLKEIWFNFIQTCTKGEIKTRLG